MPDYPLSRNRPARVPLSISYAEVATHNHFAVDHGGKVFTRTAPIIKLQSGTPEADYVAITGVLNCSTVAFWLRNTVQPKGSSGVGRGVYDEAWERHYQFAATPTKDIPMPSRWPAVVASALQAASTRESNASPSAVIARFLANAENKAAVGSSFSLMPSLNEAAAIAGELGRERIGLQEELDWQCYSIYGLLEEPLAYLNALPQVNLGERAFEIALARRVAAGETTTTWFQRHGSTSVTEIPPHWPADYRALVQKRLEAILENPSVKLIEQPEYKRRWNSEPWANRQEAALQDFLLARLERLFDHDGRMNDKGTPTATLPVTLVSLGHIADAARRDPLFMEAAEVYESDPGFDVGKLVAALVEGESVPLLPQLRYKPSGLRKRAEWERTWEWQRKEDAIDVRVSLLQGDANSVSAEAVAALRGVEEGDKTVAPKYKSEDFIRTSYWRMRGELDVPKERFVSFPGVDGADGSMMVAWAGLDHLQLAKAIGDFYGLVQTELGGSEDPRLVPLLAGIAELIPWVRQWHPDFLADYGSAPADFFEQFVKDEATLLRKTVAEIREWTPPAKAKKTAKKAAGKRSTAKRSAADLPPDDEAKEEMP